MKHKINVNNFIVSSLTAELDSIDKEYNELENSKKEFEGEIIALRNSIDGKEKELDDVNSSMVILKENRAIVKAKADEIKKEKK